MNTYSCWASRIVSVRLAPLPTTNSTPVIPAAVVTNEIEPSGFFFDATGLFHSPKSKTVAGPAYETEMSPSAAFE